MSSLLTKTVGSGVEFRLAAPRNDWSPCAIPEVAGSLAWLACAVYDGSQAGRGRLLCPCADLAAASPASTPAWLGRSAAGAGTGPT